MGGNGKINADQREAIGKVADALAGHRVDRNLIIEMGFASLVAAAYPDWEDEPRENFEDLRTFFFCGAQFLLGSIMDVIGPGNTPTDRELRHLEKITDELDTFIEVFRMKHDMQHAEPGHPPREMDS